MNKNRKNGKRIEGILVSICLLFIFLTGCGEVSLQEGTNLVFEKNGGVMVTYIEDFPSDYYDSDELAAMNKEEVADYNTKAGREAVEIISTEVSGDKVTLTMHYENADDYGNMNGGSFFCGTVSQGTASGYNLESPLKNVKTGELVSTPDWGDLGENRLIVAKGSDADYSATVHTYKKILYASENVTVSEDRKTAGITGNELAVIVFK